MNHKPKFKKGDKVCTPYNSHYNDKPYTVLDVDTRGVRLRGIRNHRNSDVLVYFHEHELEFWNVWKSPLIESLK